MSRPLSVRAVRRTLTALAVVAVGLTGVGTVPAAAQPTSPSAVGDAVIAFVEVEDGVISGGPALNSGDHGNFSGTGSYTFRETGMTSTMTVTAPEAGTYPIYIRYAAGLLGADENVTRSMGLTTNGTRQIVSYPMTGDWETWRVAQAQVNLNAGTNTVAINCDRGTDFCRLNFDAIQVGGTSFDTCTATPVNAGWTRLFDGTFASFDGWRKAGSGGFGRQADCTIRGFRGAGALWTTSQQTGPHTVEVDWKRSATGDASTLHLASPGRNTAASIAVPLGTGNAVGRPVGEWNTTRVEATASAVRIYLNGTLIETRGAPSALNGAIGLANPASNDGMRFKNIQVLDDYELGPVAGPVTRARLADASVNPGGESRLANLVAEAQRATTTSNGANGATQISFVHPDAVNADLTGTTTATFKQAAAVQPSTADMRNFKLTGAQIEALLEQQWSTSQPFVRLGTSTGFRYTYDPSQPQDARITDVRLNGNPVLAGTSYSVTTSAALRSDTVRFPAFTGRAGDRAANKTEQAALVEHLGSAPVVDGTQHSVGVSTPDGTTVVAGETLAVDLTSLSFTGVGDVQDGEVVVKLGATTIGTAPVVTTVDDAANDERGTASVRATIPAATPAGPASVTITGDTTGTSVTVPITVTAATPTTVDSTTSVSVAPGSLPVRQGTSSVSITVAKAGGTPTGQVELWVGGAKVSTVALVAGRATAKVGPFPTVGTRTVQARYVGDSSTNPSSSAVAAVAVVKATPRLAVAVQPAKVVAGRTKAKFVVTVAASGFTPTGRVTVKIGAKTYAGTLRAGKVTITLPKFKKAGTVRATVTYVGDALAGSVRTTKKIVVKKAPRR
ncbi:5'-nucleotidase C-terminal domain-containing protein [Nocardioides sp. 1609]|uniref:5'-nucleotidase C-terminal domain-containing protein n=1 Tax=Nocardioides sp. 1609 TaxID=2508327 RepID=UPI0014304EC7|nr:5'-nucleotidase C-terminal domain-containing protein [Nocardioides sp. 1609]